jgi:hypothetical protein
LFFRIPIQMVESLLKLAKVQGISFNLKVDK